MLGLRPLSVAGVAFLLGRVHADSDGYFRGDGTAYTLGDVSAGNCNMMTANSDAGDNYAAINDPQWSGMKNCGRCAEVSCDDDRCASKSISQVVQILDRCPECKYGDLDLSPSVFTKITGSGPARLKVKWKFVDCPVQGNIKYCLKGGSNNFWTAIQPANVVSGVANMKVNGQSTTMVTSAYYYLLDGNSQVQTDLSSVKVTLTSVNGETIQDTVSLTSGSCTTGSSQFSRGASASGNSDQADAVQETPATSAPTPTTAAPTPAPTPPPTTAAPTPESTPAPTTPASTPESTSAPTTAAPTPESTSAPTTTAPTPESTPSPTPASTPEPTSTPSVEVSDAILGANDERSYSPTPETIVTPSPSPTPTPDTPEPNIATPSPSSTPGVTPTPDVTRLPTPTSQKENISNASLQDDRVAGESTNTPAPTTKPKSTPQPASTSATPIPTTATPPSTPSGEMVQNVNNKADTGSGSGTDPLIIGMSALAAVGVFALIVVVVVVRRKRIQEKKRRDDEPVVLSSVLTRSFSGLKTPGDRTDIAML